MEKKSKKGKNVLIFVVILIIIAIGIFITYQMREKLDTTEKFNQLPINTTNSIENNVVTEEPEKEISNDLFEQYYDQAEEKLQTMSLEEKVGQMFLARYPDKNVIEEIRNQNPGGYILFSKDFKNKTIDSIKKELNNNQEASKIPLIFGVDEEGGTVVRVSAYSAFRSSPFQSPQKIYQSKGMTGIENDTVEKSKLLLSLGINLNLAPVTDVSTNSKDFIYARSFGKNAKDTAEFVKTEVETMKEEGISCCLKHFPGYGNNVDTHAGVAIDKRPYSTFETSDFIPFQQGIDSGVPMILVAHNIIESMDETYPVSLSKKVHDILRDNLNYTGIIITDDLAMDGVKSYVEEGKAAVLAVKAGNDMIISSDFKIQKEEILKVVRSGEIEEQTINDAVKRILAWKYQYDII